VIRGKDADAGRNILQALHANANTGDAQSGADRFHRHPIHEIGAARQETPQDEPGHDHQEAEDIEEDSDDGPNHLNDRATAEMRKWKVESLSGAISISVGGAAQQTVTDAPLTLRWVRRLGDATALVVVGAECKGEIPQLTLTAYA
jgi:hypothetical protein